MYINVCDCCCYSCCLFKKKDDSQAPRSPPALGAGAGVEELTDPVLPPPTFASTLESLAEISLSIEITVLRSDMMRFVFVSCCQEKKRFFFGDLSALSVFQF